MYKVIKLQDTEVFVVLTALEAYAKGPKSISAVASLIADKIDKCSWLIEGYKLSCVIEFNERDFNAADNL